MPVNFTGEWNTVSSEGTDELLSALGVTDAEILAAAKTSTEILEQGDNSLKVIVRAAKTQWKEKEYPFGSEFTDKDPAGNLWKCTASWKDDVLEITGRCEEKDCSITVTRQLKDGELVVQRNLTHSGGSCVANVRFQKV